MLTWIHSSEIPPRVDHPFLYNECSKLNLIKIFNIQFPIVANENCLEMFDKFRTCVELATVGT